MGTIRALAAVLAGAVTAAPAGAQQLDLLLPEDSVPGYDRSFSVLAEHRDLSPGATGWDWDGVTLFPRLSAASGYDSAPNGAAGSAVLTAAPSLVIADPVAGFGAFAMVSPAAYPQDARQNSTTATLAAGERIALPRETLTVAAAYLRSAVTGFDVGSPALSKPLDFSLATLRASDAISATLFTFTPGAELATYTFPALPGLNRRDTRETMTTAYAAGGPLH
jgi:hypothetical protein